MKTFFAAPLAALVRLFLRPKFTVSADGQRLQGPGVRYRGDARLKYGVNATKNRQAIRGLIIHHPASAKGSSVHNLISLINRPRADGHMYGYHFVIDVDGAIYQCAPLTKRTNHIQPRHKRREQGRELNNANALGLCFHLASHNPAMAPNAAQIAAGRGLVAGLIKIYGPLDVFGHGEIQTNRQAGEGRAFAKMIRVGCKS